MNAQTPTIVEGHQAVGGSAGRGKPDPNVVAPQQVKQAAERANELAAQAKALRDANPQGNEPVRVQLAPSANNVGAVVTNFDPRNPNPPSEEQLLGAQQLSLPLTPQSPQQPQENPEDWEHQFRSLKGRYEREAENNKRMARQIADMQQLMTLVSSPPAPAPPAPSQGSGVRFDGQIAGQRYITPKETEEYTPELMDVVGRRAREVFEPLLNPLLNELQFLRQQVGGVRSSQVYDASVKMYDVLAREVPNWNAINESAAFSHWLDQPDPISGYMRRALLDNAHGRNQAGQVVNIFRGFLNDQASYSPAYGHFYSPGNGAGNVPQLTYQPGNGQAASTPQNALMQYAAPGRAKSGQSEVPPEKPFFHASEITQLYRDKTSGKYAGREDEFLARQAALFDASKEGRIRR